MAPLEQLSKTLKRQQRSLTRARQAVFLGLLDKEPQTINQVIAACPLIDRASVYRSVKLFEDLGIVQRLPIGWKYKLELSDQFQRHHHHLTCSSCGRTIALPEDHELEKRLAELAGSLDFRMSGHQLEIQGHCQNCPIHNIA